MRKYRTCLFLAALIAVVNFFHADAHINWGDEGFLWYGAQALVKGQIPVRDFSGYDPGRYVWIAAFFKLRQDDGLMTLRMACVAFQFVGLFFGLAALSKHIRSLPLLLGSGILLYFWMLATFRLFDTSLVLIIFLWPQPLPKNPHSDAMGRRESPLALPHSLR